MPAVQNSPPSVANSTSRIRMTEPMSAVRFLMNRRVMTDRRDRASMVNSRSVAASASESGTCARRMSVKANPRIQQRVGDIGEQVEQDDEDAGDHQERQDHVGLLAVDVLDQD